MAFENLLRLANDLEWLGCELEQVGHRHAVEGYPHAGPVWQDFVEKRKGVLLTCDKIERELTGTVRFNTQNLLGLAYSLDDALDDAARLLEAVEEIKFTTVYEVHSLPEEVRNFNRMVHDGFATAAMPEAIPG
jgi:hypothetical protein